MKRNPYFYKTDSETAIVACVEDEWVIEMVQLVDDQVAVTRDNFATRDEALVYMERIGFVDADFGEWWSGSEDSPVKAHLLQHFRNNSERDAERATTISCKNCGHYGLTYCGTYELRTREAPHLAIAACPKCHEFHDVNENADNYGNMGQHRPTMRRNSSSRRITRKRDGADEDEWLARTPSLSSRRTPC